MTLCTIGFIAKNELWFSNCIILVIRSEQCQLKKFKLTFIKQRQVMRQIFSIDIKELYKQRLYIKHPSTYQKLQLGEFVNISYTHDNK